MAGVPRTLGLVVGWLLAVGAEGCGAGLGPVPRPPWVEDRTYRLVDEELVLRVEPDGVQVDARLGFATDEPVDRVVTFPVAGQAQDIRAVMILPGGVEHPLRVALAEPGPLPVGPATDAYDIEWPASSWAAGPTLWRRGVLRVQYRERATARFDYLLETGAYWAGPIDRLVVRVEDPEGLVTGATVEGQAAHRRVGHTLEWRFVGLEPRRPVSLLLR